MPARLRLAEAARQLPDQGSDDLNAAKTMLHSELKKMERVRCILCDGRGHSDKASGGVARPNERCPMRAILRRRMGKGKTPRRILNLAISSVIAEDKATFKFGHVGQMFIGGRQVGKYCHSEHLSTILTQWETDKHAGATVASTAADVAAYCI